MTHLYSVIQVASQLGVKEKSLSSAIAYHLSSHPRFKNYVETHNGKTPISEKGVEYLKLNYRPRTSKSTTPMQVAEEKYENIRGELELGRLPYYPSTSQTIANGIAWGLGVGLVLVLIALLAIR